MRPFLGSVAHVSEGVGRSARRLGEGVHRCVVPDRRLRHAWVCGTQFVRRLGVAVLATQVSTCPACKCAQ